MNYAQAIILGLVQGIAEFFPVSSSGHLVIFKNLFGLGEIPMFFDIGLHIATLFAVLIVFRKRIGGIFVSFWRLLRRKNGPDDADNLAILLPGLVATLITAVIGYAIQKFLPPEGAKIASLELLVTATILIGTAFLRPGKGEYKSMTIGQGALIGLAQGFGVFSGISRSGMTISAGMALGMRRDMAGEFSFLLSIPAILGAFALTLKDAAAVQSSIDAGPLAVAFVTAFASGLFALSLLVKVVKNGKIAWFAAYLVPVGIVGLLFF
jgi:undecaprenyl-diphosphatase